MKNREKQTVEHLEGLQNGNDNGATKPESRKPSDNLKEAHSKEFDRQSTITRLAVLSTATEIIKTWGKPVEFSVTEKGWA